MEFDLYQIAIVALVVFYSALPAKVYGFLSAVSLFFYAQTIMGLGIFPLLDYTIQADRLHARLIFFTLLTFVATTTVMGMVHSHQTKKSTPIVNVLTPKLGAWFLIIISIIISSLYFAAVGYMALFESIRGVFQGSETDATTLRLNSYSGDSYYFPGYVNQFKNSLLPALSVITIHHFYQNNSAGKHWIAITLVTLSTVFLMGTGQRGAFVTFLIIVIVYVRLVNRVHFKKILFWIGGFGTSLFFLSTVASGRASDELASEESGLGQMEVLFSQLIFRFTGSNQLSAVAGFRYIYDEPVQYGADWIKSMIGLLPGVAGSDLDNQIFATLYGSTRGTAPPSIWGSIYYNFGTIGCILLSILFALILIKVSILASKISSINTYQAMGIAGVSVVAGTWIAGAPVYFFNVGIVVYILFWIYGSIQSRNNNSKSQSTKERNSFPMRSSSF